MDSIELTIHVVRTWIQTMATGEFHYTKVLDGLVQRQSHGRLRTMMSKLCYEKNPVVEPVGRRDGYYRPVQPEEPDLDWKSIEKGRDSGLVLPFDLRKYVFIYPDTTTVVAGSKSAGKTGFLYRTIVLNMDKINTVLLTNLEGGISMLRDRFDAMNLDIPDPPRFKTKPAFENFHDFIKLRDTLYVIDYIDAPDGTDFFLIGAQIKRVDQKLQGLNSVAVIGLQKPAQRDLPFGGEQTLKAATLILAMDSNKLKILDAKVPADPKVHPKNMQWTFQYSENGTGFANIQPYYGE
tara:strand:- start:3553 stop:4431 length:879 start_codon:yes stop_codon:yes gene_type:complete